MTDQSTPFINIGIMTHNYGRYISEAIESVLAQSFTNWELIISDDCSSDNTAEIVAPYLTDSRIRYVYHETNLGQAANWGFLLQQGNAPVLAVLHADDAWLPNTLERVASEFKNNNKIDLVYGNWWCRFEDPNKLKLAREAKSHTVTGYAEYQNQVRQFTCLPSATFISRHCVTSIGLPDKSLSFFMDAEYFLRSCASARYVKSVAEPITVYRIHQSSATADVSGSNQIIDEQERLMQLCLPHIVGKPAHGHTLSVMRDHLARRVFATGIAKITQGEVKDGRRLIKRGIRFCPRLMINPKILLDCLLVAAGRPCYPLFLLIHRRRMTTNV